MLGYVLFGQPTVILSRSPCLLISALYSVCWPEGKEKEKEKENEREKERERKREREREREEREREKEKERGEKREENKREREREQRERRRGTRKTPLCERSRRLRVYGQDASVCTCNGPACVQHAGRPDRTHGGVLNVHTGWVFRVPTHTIHHTRAPPHNTNTHTTHTTTCTRTQKTTHHTHHTHHTPHTHHNTHHIRTTISTHTYTTHHTHHTTPTQHSTSNNRPTFSPMPFLIKTVTPVTPVMSVIFLRSYCFRINIKL